MGADAGVGANDGPIVELTERRLSADVLVAGAGAARPPARQRRSVRNTA